MGSADTEPVCVSKERFTHTHTRDDDNEKGRAQCGPDLNAHQLHRDYAFTQLGSAHSCLPSASYKEPCTYHSSETAQTRDSKLCKAGQTLKLSVSKGEMKTLDFLKQQHCVHKRQDVPNTGSNVKKRQIFKESELHRRNVRVRNEQAIKEAYFGLFSIVRGKAVLTCTALNLKAPYNSKESDAREHKPNGGAYKTGLVLPERGINTFQH